MRVINDGWLAVGSGSDFTSGSRGGVATGSGLGSPGGRDTERCMGTGGVGSGGGAVGSGGADGYENARF